jgi:NADH:ubiquinone oxidoreductase subunit 6 (subunit J)
VTTVATALINTDALWKIVVASLIGGVGVVVAFGVMLLGISRAGTPGRSPVGRAGSLLLAGLCGLFCVAAIAVGIYAMAQKPASPAPKPAAKAAATVPQPRL